MIKCDFCHCSNPDGTCSWENPYLRESDCKKAIEKMCTTLKSTNKKSQKHSLGNLFNDEYDD